MKIICILLLTFVLFSCVTSNPYEFNLRAYERLDKRYAAAIIEFENKTKYGQRRLSDSASEILTTEMLRTGNFFLVERERIEEVKKELDLENSGLTESAYKNQLRKLLNTQYLLIGVISNFGVTVEGKDFLLYKEKIQRASSEVDIRVIDVETGRIVYSAFGRGVVEKKYSQTMGLGDVGGYDEALAGDCLRLAINDAVINLISFFKHNIE